MSIAPQYEESLHIARSLRLPELDVDDKLAALTAMGDELLACAKSN